MNISLAASQSKASLYALWRTCFHDKDETIDLFFRRAFDAQNTVICKDGARLAAMLFLLPEKIRIQKRDYTAYYIYAAATAPEYRKRGIMSDMLTFCEQLCCARDIDFLFLVPADEALFAYYGKRGFVPAFRQKALLIPQNHLKKMSENSGEQPALLEQADLKTQREAALGGFDFVEWRENELLLSCDFLKRNGGKTVVFAGGYFAGEIDGNTAEVYEFCVQPHRVLPALALLNSVLPAQQYRLHFAERYPLICDAFQTAEAGMLRRVSRAAKQLSDLSLLHIYLGITLE